MKDRYISEQDRIQPILKKKVDLRVEIINLMEKISPLRISQVVEYISRLDGDDEKYVLHVINKCKAAKEIYVTAKTGYVSRGKLEENGMTGEMVECMDAFDVVLTLLPDSRNFVMCSYPITLTFIAKSKIIEVVNFSSDSSVLLQNKMLQRQSKELSDDEKESISRIAIIEDVDDADNIYDCGVTNICIVSDGVVKIIKKIPHAEAWG